MSARSQCKQCAWYDECKQSFPFEYADIKWETMEEKRQQMIRMMMDCFKSPEERARDLITAAKSREIEANRRKESV